MRKNDLLLCQFIIATNMILGIFAICFANSIQQLNAILYLFCILGVLGVITLLIKTK